MNRRKTKSLVLLRTSSRNVFARDPGKKSLTGSNGFRLTTCRNDDPVKRISAKLTAIALVLNLYAPALFASDEIINQGKIGFDMHCARCHGPQGRGDGYDAKRLYVAPRDLTSGKFKFKTTVSGTPPSDEDLINRIVGHGVTGSGMPSFANLESDVKNAIVQYVKTLSPVFQGSKPEPIAPPSNLRASVDLKKGAEVFNKLQCALCHGANGRANGTSAGTLVDGWGQPIKVANLTQGWSYGGGSKPIDIYHRILAGIEGAPMPSYEGAVTHEEAWLLSNYVASLQLKANWADSIYIFKGTESLPQQTSDPVWDKSERTDLLLDGYVIQNNRRVPLTVNSISVQAVANKEGVAFRLVWDDPIKNEKGLSDTLLMAILPQDYSGDARGNLFTLTSYDSSPLDIVQWKAEDLTTFSQRKSTLISALNNLSGAERFNQVQASFDDGRWTLVLQRLFKQSGDLEALLKKPIRIGFSLTDGANNETGVKRSSSRWVWLSLAEKEVKHH